MGSSRKTHPIYPNICENFAANIVDFEERALLTFPDYPLTYRSLITIVIHADFKQALAISRIRNQISLVIYLPDCILGRAIILQLENKHGISIKVLGTAQVEMKHWVNV